MKLSTAEPELIAALQRMVELPTSLRPFVICEATSGQFVQFRGSVDEELLLDVPEQKTPHGYGLAAFQISYPDKPTAVARAAHAGLLFLRTRLGIDESTDADVTITEDVTSQKGSA